MFYPGKSRVYVAYTAKNASGGYDDYILALKTSDIQSGNIGSADDYVKLASVPASGEGRVRFSGFAFSPPSGDSVDVLAVYYMDSFGRPTLAVFRQSSSPLAVSVYRRILDIDVGDRYL